jgi:predicted nuclease with TOPRIM domain
MGGRMMKYNREQIEKAAEILEGAKVMVLNRDFDDFQNAIITALNTFALIKELTEENEKLNERLDREAKCQYDLATKIVNLRDDVKYIKAETVRKMQKRLTSDEFYIVADDYDGMQYVDFCAWVEEVAKELLEENK